jgi:transposase
MPSKTEKYRIKDPFLDRRRKLIPCQIERIKDMYHEGYSMSALAKIFKVYVNSISTVLGKQKRVKCPKRTSRQKALNVKNVLKHRRLKRKFKTILKTYNEPQPLPTEDQANSDHK